ncbi:MAG: Ca2+-dependent phosphoinositide-specific phospholipase C, partial [Acholeplasmataceae bacterium]|nr:Ca2+-dependent phosphoinositide-specific phospholipase C [Acholeplasmataceae bacterium]
TTGWPSVHSLLGKVIFVLHPGNFTQMYYNLDQSLATLPMFIGGYSEGVNQDYASFIVNNNPSIAEIAPLVAENFIVRTRIDSNLVFNATDFENAVSSGAQILTSDFLIGRSDIKTSDIIYLANDKMIIKKNP